MPFKWNMFITVMLVSGCTLLGSIYFYYTWKNGAFMNIQGTLLVPINFDTIDKEGKSGFYEIVFPKGTVDRLYFSDDRYEKYMYPSMKKGIFFCVAKKKAIGEFVLLEVREEQVSELMHSDKEIHFPVVSEDLNSIWYLNYEKNENKIASKKSEWNTISLWKYNRKTGMKEKLFDDHISFSSSILVTLDDSIILTQNSDEGDSKIIQVSPTGDINVLIAQSNSPAWYEEGKSILYRDVKKQINKYDLKTGEITNLGSDNRWWRYSPVVSPDKKYLVINDYELLYVFGGERDNQLKVISVDGKVECAVKFAKQTSDIMWLK